MKKAIAAAFVCVLIAPACLGGGTNERTVRVDNSHDEFASIMVGFFPGKMTVAAGDTIVFRQTWTGEPHTVTGGTLVNQMMKKAGIWTSLFSSFEALLGTGAKLPDPENPSGSLEDFFDAVGKVKNAKLKADFYEAYDNLVKRYPKIPARDDVGDATFEDFTTIVDKESTKFYEDLGLPWAFGEDNVTQNGGQPCFLTKGKPPKDEDKPCPKSRQQQPAFDGKASYYNSGIIPYEGPQGNVFRVDLADDIRPGKYSFYCAVHGPEQATEVTVKAKGSEIPPQSDVNRLAQKEIADFAKPLAKAYKDAQDGKVSLEGETIRGPFAGVFAPVFGSVNEFVPKTVRTKVGEKVTWKMMGWDHTISFEVPSYFPVVRFAKNGKVSFNPKLEPAAGGSPKVPDRPAGPPVPGIVKINGGTYDGTGFFSSGLISAEPYAEYSLRFSKRGSYKFACLLHPPMVGTVVVT